jgi:hypothetical protein
VKKQINEIKRMQFLAGLITETESKTPTPQQVVSIIPKLEDKLEKSPEIKSMGDKIAADPKAVEQLMNILKQNGINPASLNENSSDAVEKLALAFANKAQDKLTEIDSDEDVTGPAMAGLAGLFGGGPLAAYILPKLDLFTHYYTDVWNQTHTVVATPALIGGAVLGAILGFIGTYVIGKLADRD